MQNFQLKGGVIIVGSLLWQNDLKLDSGDGIRCHWRVESLNLCNKILARLPIRYGRYSNGNIYTMVFSTNCEKSDRFGTGFIVPFRKNPIRNVDGVISEARMMAMAEGMDCKFIGGTNPIWASMGILLNKAKVEQGEIYKSVSERWKKAFTDDGGGQDSSEYRVGREKLSITKKGELQIGWPKSFDPDEQSKIDDLDFLIATSTRPKYQGPGGTKYPSEREIACSVNKDSKRKYFLNNYQNTITTFQDNKIINLL